MHRLPRHLGLLAKFGRPYCLPQNSWATSTALYSNGGENCYKSDSEWKPETLKRKQKDLSLKYQSNCWMDRNQVYIINNEYMMQVTGQKSFRHFASLRKALPKHHNSPNVISKIKTRSFAGKQLNNFNRTNAISIQHFHTSSINREINGKTEKKLSQKEKLKKNFKEHGATGVVLYGGLWVISISACYLAVQSGIDVISLLQKFGAGENVLQSKFATEATTFAIAYALHSVAAPVRIGLTVTGTPLVVRYLRSSGKLKN